MIPIPAPNTTYVVNNNLNISEKVYSFNPNCLNVSVCTIPSVALLYTKKRNFNYEICRCNKWIYQMAFYGRRYVVLLWLYHK